MPSKCQSLPSDESLPLDLTMHLPHLPFPVTMHPAIVKLSQLGHSAVYCVGGMMMQLSWLAYLGPVTPVRCMARPWMLGTVIVTMTRPVASYTQYPIDFL
jgi:hypothetical protein